MERKNFAISMSCLLALLFGACSKSPSDAVGPSGASGSTAAAASIAPTGSAQPTISQFSPLPGNVTIFPTSVEVFFSESTMDPNTAGNRYDWTYVCGGLTQYPSSVSIVSGVATLVLPTVSNPYSGESCTLSASSAIADTSGNTLSGTMSATYTLGAGGIGGTQPTISQFSPAAGSYSAMPSSISVTFSDPAMTTTSVTNTSNWTIQCGSQLYKPNSVHQVGSTATLQLPSTVANLTYGSCTLYASSAIQNSSGAMLSGNLSATYALTGAAGTSGIIGFAPFGGNAGNGINYCLDVLNDNVNDGGSFDSSYCNGTQAQNLVVITSSWTGISTISPAQNTGLCLDVLYAQYGNGTIDLTYCNGTLAQQWRIQNENIVSVGNSQYCLDVHYANLNDGAPIGLAPCDGSQAQKFQPIY